MEKVIHRELRDSLPRLRVLERGVDVELRVPGGVGLSGRVVDFGRRGLGVVLGGDAGDVLGGVSRVEVYLGGMLEGLEAEVAYIRGGEVFVPSRGSIESYPGKRVGLRLLGDWDRPLSELTFSSTDDGWDLLRDRSDVEGLFVDLLAYGTGTEMRVYRGRESVVGRLCDHGLLREQRFIRVEVGEDVARGFELGEELVVVFERYGCTYLFHGELSRRVVGELWFSIPRSAIRLLRRRTNRLVGDVVGDFRLSLEHPVLGEGSGLLRVLSINEQGCCVRVSSDFLLVPVYLRGVRGELRWGVGGGFSDGGGGYGMGGGIVIGEVVDDIEFEVCSVRDAGGGYVDVGIGFRFLGEDGRRRLTAELIRRRRPMIDIVYRDDDHPKIWKMFDESGYLDIKSREAFRYMYNKSADAWAKLDKGRDIISRKIMVRVGDEIKGHIQLERVYPETWMSHQFAIHPTMLKSIAAHIYASVTDFLAGRGIKYFMTSVDSGKAWNHKTYFDFIKNYPFSGHHDLSHSDLFEFNFSDERNEIFKDLDRDIRRGNYTEFDLKTILRFFELHYPPLRRKVYALDRENIFLEKEKKLYESYSLKRERDFIVYKKGKKLLGFSMLEMGSEGINICNLYNQCRICFLADISESEKIEAANFLLRASARTYFENGVPGFMLFQDENLLPKEFVEKLGFSYIYLEARWITDTRASKRFEAYTATMFGRILARRERRKKKKISDT